MAQIHVSRHLLHIFLGALLAHFLLRKLISCLVQIVINTISQLLASLAAGYLMKRMEHEHHRIRKM